MAINWLRTTSIHTQSPGDEEDVYLNHHHHHHHLRHYATYWRHFLSCVPLSSSSRWSLSWCSGGKKGLKKEGGGGEDPDHRSLSIGLLPLKWRPGSHESPVRLIYFPWGVCALTGSTRLTTPCHRLLRCAAHAHQSAHTHPQYKTEATCPGTHTHARSVILWKILAPIANLSPAIRHVGPVCGTIWLLKYIYNTYHVTYTHISNIISFTICQFCICSDY